MMEASKQEIENEHKLSQCQQLSHVQDLERQIVEVKNRHGSVYAEEAGVHRIITTRRLPVTRLAIMSSAISFKVRGYVSNRWPDIIVVGRPKVHGYHLLPARETCSCWR